MRHPALLITLVATLFSAHAARADQLQCNSQANAQRAVDALPAGSLMLDYCSNCDAKVQVVKVQQAASLEDCEWEVSVRGQVEANSTRSFSNGEGVASASYETSQVPYAGRVDLAYVYVETAPNTFKWLGGQLGLKADVKVATMHLPAKLYEGLGPHSLPSLDAEISAALPLAPNAESVHQVWDYYYHAQGGAPILVRLTPCLKVDLEKGSDTRYECIEPLQGTVQKGQTVSAWMSWLVPSGDTLDDLMVQWLYKGVVRSTRDLKINGKGFRYRTYLSKRLRKAGRWEVVVLQGDKELGRAEIEVDAAPSSQGQPGKR